jgi:hypothetical protein
MSCTLIESSTYSPRLRLLVQREELPPVEAGRLPSVPELEMTLAVDEKGVQSVSYSCISNHFIILVFTFCNF